MDPLGEALHFLRMSGTSYCTSELTAPWGLQLPEVKGGLTFHVLTSGRCWLEVPGSRRRQLEPGERPAWQPEAAEAGWRQRDGHVAGLRARHQHGFTRAELDLPTALRCVHAAACGDR